MKHKDEIAYLKLHPSHSLSRRSNTKLMKMARWWNTLDGSALKLIVSFTFLLLGSSGPVLCTIEESIIPPWLDAYNTTPDISMNLQFAESSASFAAILAVLSLNDTELAPNITIFGSSLDPGTYYAFLMLDPDAISVSRPFLKAVCHAAILNIPGNISSSQDIFEAGDVVKSYANPKKPTSAGPPPYGIHRYFCLLFQQKEGKIEGEISVPLWNFNAREFIDAYALGYPVAGLIFFVDIDS